MTFAALSSIGRFPAFLTASASSLPLTAKEIAEDNVSFTRWAIDFCFSSSACSSFDFCLLVSVTDILHEFIADNPAVAPILSMPTKTRTAAINSKERKNPFCLIFILLYPCRFTFSYSLLQKNPLFFLSFSKMKEKTGIIFTERHNFKMQLKDYIIYWYQIYRMHH